MHGSMRLGRYESDLPVLELQYGPELTLKSITSLLTDDGVLNGIQLELGEKSGDETLKMRKIGGEGSQEKRHEITEDVDGIFIIHDNDVVCDIKLTMGADIISLSEDDTGLCDLDINPNVDYTELQFDEDYPMVGLHGKSHHDNLLNLGVIWLDRLNPMCQERLPLEMQQAMRE